MFMVLTLSLIYAGLANTELADTTATAATPPSAPSAANRISLDIHENFASVLTARVDGVNVRLQFDLGSYRFPAESRCDPLVSRTGA